MQDLTLSLRRLSEKLDATENVLFERQMELARALSEREKAFHDAEHMRSLLQEFRLKEHEHSTRERDLIFLSESARHEKDMALTVIQDYAELVKTLQSRNEVKLMDGKDIEEIILPTMQNFQEIGRAHV